jgi:hypothetical protein
MRNLTKKDSEKVKNKQTNPGNEKLNKSKKKVQWKESPIDYVKWKQEHQGLMTRRSNYYI